MANEGLVSDNCFQEKQNGENAAAGELFCKDVYDYENAQCVTPNQSPESNAQSFLPEVIVGQPLPASTERPNDRTASVSDKTIQRLEDLDNPFNHLALAEQELARAGKLTARARAEYEAAIKASDCVDARMLLQSSIALDEKLSLICPRKAPSPEDILAAKQELTDKLNVLPKEKRDRLEELSRQLSEATTTDAQEKVKRQVRELVPDVARKLAEIEPSWRDPAELEAPDLHMIFLYQEKILALKYSPAITRAEYAKALQQSGDEAAARKLQEEALALDPLGAQGKQVLQDLRVEPVITSCDGEPVDVTAGIPDPSAAILAVTEMLGDFDSLDQSKDGFLSSEEIDGIVQSMTGDELNSSRGSLLIELQEHYQAISDAANDEWGRETTGISKRDLYELKLEMDPRQIEWRSHRRDLPPITFAAFDIKEQIDHGK